MTIYNAHLKSNNQLQAIKIMKANNKTERERGRKSEREGERERESAESILDKPVVGH